MLTGEGLEPVVTTNAQDIKRNQNQFQVLYLLLYAAAAIDALVGILGLFNTLTTSVLERRREIGVLRSLGGNGARVAAVFWIEGLALAGIAWALAVVLGLLGRVRLHKLDRSGSHPNRLCIQPDQPPADADLHPPGCHRSPPDPRAP